MKKRLKLYKSGKLWLCATIVFAGLIIGMSSEGIAHADAVANNDATIQSTLATDTGHTDSSNNIVNNQVPVDRQTQNNDLNANVGSLDTYQIQINPQTHQVTLHASGWQATGHSDDQRYRYAIAYDNTLNKELNRQRITPQIRTDVQNVYPNIANSRLSGFDVNFKLPNNLAGHSISIIARYSDDEINGEGHHTDYWSSPIIFDNQNRASLDELSSNDHGDLIVSGWHATNLALGKNYHYIIAYDQTQNHEIARAQVMPTERGDVAQVFPTIANAKNSGFHVQFKLNPEYAQDSIEFISRWTDDPSGNGDAVDYWFAPIQKVNRGNLDSWNLSSGDLTVSGWHANDAAICEPYHYLIIFDNTANRQVATQRVVTISSPDVARVYNDTRSAGQSRFNITLKGLNLLPSHSYSIVSRYSASPNGNGDDGTNDHTDYWYPPFTLAKQACNVDGWSTSGNQLTVNGWFANDESLSKPHAFVILLADNQEVGRHEVVLTSRNDVAQAYPTLYKSGLSGFVTTFTLPTGIKDNLQLVLRFSDQSDGEGQYADIWTNKYVANAGNIDNVTTKDGRLTVSGWHASEDSRKPYQYLFAIDAETNQEITRWQISSANDGLSRTDVQRAYPWIINSNNSGLNVEITNYSILAGHEVKFMHRYTDDPVGNGHSTDYWDNAVFYFDPLTSRLIQNQFLVVPGQVKAVYFGADGRRMTGRVSINGRDYYFDPATGRLMDFTGRIENIINWFRSRRGRITYSMAGSRNGSDGTADCSGSIVQAVRDAGGIPYAYLYDTETMHEYIQENGYYLAGEGTGRIQVQYGDIVIWGRRGRSEGSFGHTVTISTMGSGNNINCISTCARVRGMGNAVQEYNYYIYWAYDGYPYQYIYRPYKML